MFQIGLSTCGGKEICEDLFRAYRDAGIEAMEISVSAQDCERLNYAQIKSWADKYAVALWSFHLPFSPFSEIEMSKGTLCRKTLGYFEELIKKASSVGIEKFIVHPSGEPISDGERSERMKCAKESLAALAEIARKNHAVIAVEDLPRTCLGKNSDEIAELISVSDDLMVCFDTNHLLHEDPADFIHKMGKRIVTTHVSDYDFVNERHWLPGEGQIDWQKILQAFRDIDYTGVWLYEIGFSCPKTILRERDLTCQDFVRNARQLFGNQPITVFSTPKENLGMWE